MKVATNVSFTKEQLFKLKSISADLTFLEDPNDVSADILIGEYKAPDLKKFENLKLYLATAVGYDAFIKKGILKDDTILCNGVDVHTEEVAEHLFALMTSCLKNLPYYRDEQNKQTWKDLGVVKSYVGLRVCIIGFGDIGNYLAKLCHALGMYVVGVKRKPISKPDYVDEIVLSEQMDEVISDVDVIVSILPGTKENVHLFSKERFKKMRPDTIFINGGRGNLIDTNELYEICNEKIIKCVASDVFETEPLPKDSKLYKLENLIITPHIAGFFHLDKAKEKFTDLCVKNLRAFLNNEECPTIVKEREE